MSKPIGGTGKISTPYGDVNVKFTYRIVNDGIGAYEFWGAKCYDSGVDYPEFDVIEPIFSDESLEERQQIREYLNEKYEDYVEQLENIVNTVDDY